MTPGGTESSLHLSCRPGLAPSAKFTIRLTCGIVRPAETKAPLLHDCVVPPPARPGRLLRWLTASFASKSYKIMRAAVRARETEGRHDQDAIYRTRRRRAPDRPGRDAMGRARRTGCGRRQCRRARLHH